MGQRKPLLETNHIAVCVVILPSWELVPETATGVSLPCAVNVSLVNIGIATVIPNEKQK